MPVLFTPAVKLFHIRTAKISLAMHLPQFICVSKQVLPNSYFQSVHCQLKQLNENKKSHTSLQTTATSIYQTFYWSYSNKAIRIAHLAPSAPVFTGRIPFLPLNQQHQSTEGISSTKTEVHNILHCHHRRTAPWP